MLECMEPLLLSTDFDGTLLDHDLPGPMCPEFFDWLEKERERRHVIWAINTGRHWQSLEVEMETRGARFWPDWVILIEREIHRLNKGQPIALESWNRRCKETHADLFSRADTALAETRERLSSFQNLEIVQDVGSPLGLIAKDNAQANDVEVAIAPLLDSFPEMHVVRNDIYFRFAHVDFHKGSCLGMVLTEEKISVENCFAAGDNANDLPMLDRKYAGYLACPSNSLKEVKEKVRSQGGYVASQPAGKGITEALEHFFKSV